MSFDGFKERYNYVKDNWLKSRKEKLEKKKDQESNLENDKMISKTEESQLSNKLDDVMAKKDLINAQNMIRKQ